MTFYKERYLRPTGRFHAIWRAAHGILVNPKEEDEDLMDICADLAHLLNPTRRARRQQQMLSLRFASTLVAGTTARHSQLTDELLQDAANLLHEIQISNHTDKDLEDYRMTVQNEDVSEGSEINTENILLIHQSTSHSNLVDTSSNADHLQLSEVNPCEIYNDEQDESMSIESTEENRNDCDNNNVDDGSNHVDENTNNDEINSDTSVNKYMSTEDLNESINQEHTSEYPKAKNAFTSATSQFVSQFSPDSFDHLLTSEYASVHANISKLNTQENVENVLDSSNLYTVMVTAKDFSLAQDTRITPEKSNINQSTTVLATGQFASTLTEFSPIIHLSSDKRLRYEVDRAYEQTAEQEGTVDQQTSENTVNRGPFRPTNAISSTTILELHKSPNLGTNPCYSENMPPINITQYRRRSLTSIDQDNEEPAVKRIRIAHHHNLPGIREVQEFPLDLTTTHRPVNERRREIRVIIPDLPLDLRSPIHIEMGSKELQIPDLLDDENVTTRNESQLIAVDSTRDNSEINIHSQALDTSSWITMTDPALSTSVLIPAEISAHNPQASLPPGTRGVVTAPATRRRRVRKPRATLYRARKVKMTRSSPPLTRLRRRQSGASLDGQNAPRAARSVTSQMTDRTSLGSSLVLQGNQSFTEIMEDQEMRHMCLTRLDTSATETVQPRTLICQDTAISPTNIELPVITYKDQIEDENFFRSFSPESTELIFQESPPQDSILSFEIAEQALSSPIIRQSQPVSSNQCDDRIASTSSSSEYESQIIIVRAEIHEPPKESISVTPSASELILSSTAEQNESVSFRHSSISQSTDSSNFTEADSTTTDEEVQQETSLLEISVENEQVDEEQSPPIIQEPEPFRRYVPKGRPLETILEESEPRYSEEHTVDKEINENETIEEFEEDNVRKETLHFQENNTNQDQVNTEIDIQNKDYEEDMSNEHCSQGQTSSIIDGEDEVPSLNEIIDDVQIYGELDISREDNEPIRNAASDVETTCSRDSFSTVSSLGLDCFSIIYKRDDPSRAVIMRSRVSDDPVLSKYISRRWMNQFN